MDVCRYCGVPLTLTQRLFGDGVFCCGEHKSLYREETERAALEVLTRYRDSEPPAPRAAPVPPPAPQPAEAPLADWLHDGPDLRSNFNWSPFRQIDSGPAADPYLPVLLPAGLTATPFSSPQSGVWPGEAGADTGGEPLPPAALGHAGCALFRTAELGPVDVLPFERILVPDEFYTPVLQVFGGGSRIASAGGLCPLEGPDSAVCLASAEGRTSFRRAEAGPPLRSESVPPMVGAGHPHGLQMLESRIRRSLSALDQAGSLRPRSFFKGQVTFRRAETGGTLYPRPLAPAPPPERRCTPARLSFDRGACPEMPGEPRPSQEPYWILSRPRPLPAEGRPPLLVSRPMPGAASPPPSALLEPRVDFLPGGAAASRAMGSSLTFFQWTPAATWSSLRLARPAAPPRALLAASLPAGDLSPAALPLRRIELAARPVSVVAGEVRAPRLEAGRPLFAIAPVRTSETAPAVGAAGALRPFPIGLSWIESQLELADWLDAEEAESPAAEAEGEFRVTMTLARPKLIREAPGLQSLRDRLWQLYVPRFDAPTLRPRVSVGPRPAPVFGYS